MYSLILFLKIALILAVFALCFAMARTWQMERRSEQTLFTGGKLPALLPDGVYKGTVPGHQGLSWLGKKFMAASATGSNVFEGGVEKYPFITSVGRGARDKNVDVLRIDYNIAGNPLWLRPILDEIVETSPGHYLGKMHLRLIPFYPLTLIYFTLEKP